MQDRMTRRGFENGYQKLKILLIKQETSLRATLSELDYGEEEV